MELIARTHCCMRNDSEMHETVLLDCTMGVQSSNNSRVRFTVISHTPVRSRFYHIFCTNGIEMAFGWWIKHKKVTHSYIFFKFAICFIALLSLGETCHLKGRDMVTVWRTLLLLSCYDCDSTCQHYDVTRFSYVYCDVAQCMNGLWIFITKHESPKGDS